jgi:hypothetical protein
MSVPRLTKKYKKLAKECNFQFFRNKTYLITDSKGDCVKRVSPSIGRFEIISKKGTNFADNDFIRSVAEKIKEDKPIILFWNIRIDCKEREVYLYKTTPLPKC